jgi:hypothetical protein
MKFRGEPPGALDISTNVPGVTLYIDDQPQPGNGSHFSVSGLSPSARHRVMVRRDGFQTFVQEVPVRGGETTPMQVALVPDPAAAMRMMQGAAPTPQPGMPGVTAGAMYPGVMPQPMAPTPNVAVAPTPMAAVPQPVVAPQPVAAPQPQPVQQPAPVQQPVAAVQAPTPAPAAPAEPAHHAGGGSHRVAHAAPPPVVHNNPPPSSGGGGGGSGFLSISTRPASQCSVAGHSFSTPRLRLELPAGTHRVSCQNSDFNVSGNFTVTIHAGQETREINHALN